MIIRNLLLILLISIVLAACSTGTKENETFKVSDGDPVVFTHDLEGGMDALISGVLEYDNETKCLYLMSTVENNLNPVDVPFWPKGTIAYTENGLHGVKVPDYGTILEGDAIEGGGGGVDVSNLESECLEEGNPFAVTSINK